MSNKNGIFPGTFDPITNGHVDLIERASTLFPNVLVAIADNVRKTPLFSVSERVNLAQEALKHLPNVSVKGFSTLLADFARENQAQVIIRGVRAALDFEHEFQLANMNRRLDPSLETVFLIPSEQFSCVSSSLIKEIASLRGDVNAFVPVHVVAALHARYNR